MKTRHLLAAVMFIGLFSPTSKAQETTPIHELNNKGKLYFFGDGTGVLIRTQI